MVFFVYVLPDFRRCGLGRALLSRLSQAFRAEGTELLALDSAFLPPEFGKALESSGFTSYGCRGYFQS
jgi:GNAT superfamily N-acetyltransferase